MFALNKWPLPIGSSSPPANKLSQRKKQVQLNSSAKCSGWILPNPSKEHTQELRATAAGMDSYADHRVQRALWALLSNELLNLPKRRALEVARLDVVRLEQHRLSAIVVGAVSIDAMQCSHPCNNPSQASLPLWRRLSTTLASCYRPLRRSRQSRPVQTHTITLSAVRRLFYHSVIL